MILRKLLLLILFAPIYGFVPHGQTLTRLPKIRVCNLDKGSRKGSRQVFLCVPPGSNGGDGEGGGGRGELEDEGSTAMITQVAPKLTISPSLQLSPYGR